ncbi:hypothetical protein X797_003066 [Metarhizium robertsii]|uniref:Uncharacterized protein n=1 Tax=Metarhizium robertsii TaxID=568076 RepID=A0A0A1V0V5_9HYPO|nr:hypothetical protein X797_003066 [Metarhizium robertsii]
MSQAVLHQMHNRAQFAGARAEKAGHSTLFSSSAADRTKAFPGSLKAPLLACAQYSGLRKCQAIGSSHDDCSDWAGSGGATVVRTRARFACPKWSPDAARQQNCLINEWTLLYNDAPPDGAIPHGVLYSVLCVTNNSGGPVVSCPNQVRGRHKIRRVNFFFDAECAADDSRRLRHGAGLVEPKIPRASQERAPHSPFCHRPTTMQAILRHNFYSVA